MKNPVNVRIEKELKLANIKLAIQDKEKNKRTAELDLANTELAYEHKEKENRAAELVIANKELAFQTLEKEERAMELLAVNSDLKKAEQYQKLYMKGLTQLIFFISHRVRQPISQIVGISNLLQSSKNSDEDVKQMVGHVKTSASRLDIFTRHLTKLITKLSYTNPSKK